MLLNYFRQHNFLKIYKIYSILDAFRLLFLEKEPTKKLSH